MALSFCALAKRVDAARDSASQQASKKAKVKAPGELYTTLELRRNAKDAIVVVDEPESGKKLVNLIVYDLVPWKGTVVKAKCKVTQSTLNVDADYVWAGQPLTQDAGTYHLLGAFHEGIFCPVWTGTDRSGPDAVDDLDIAFLPRLLAEKAFVTQAEIEHETPTVDQLRRCRSLVDANPITKTLCWKGMHAFAQGLLLTDDDQGHPEWPGFIASLNDDRFAPLASKMKKVYMIAASDDAVGAMLEEKAPVAWLRVIRRAHALRPTEFKRGEDEGVVTILVGSLACAQVLHSSVMSQSLCDLVLPCAWGAPDTDAFDPTELYEGKRAVRCSAASDRLDYVSLRVYQSMPPWTVMGPPRHPLAVGDFIMPRDPAEAPFILTDVAKFNPLLHYRRNAATLADLRRSRFAPLTGCVKYVAFYTDPTTTPADVARVWECVDGVMFVLAV